MSDKLDQLRCKLFCGGSPKLMKYYVSSTLSVINQFEKNAHQLQMHLEEEFNWKLWWKWNDNCELNLQTGLSEESANRCSESVAKDFLMDVRCNLLLSLLLRTSQNPTAVRGWCEEIFCLQLLLTCRPPTPWRSIRSGRSLLWLQINADTIAMMEMGSAMMAEAFAALREE